MFNIFKQLKQLKMTKQELEQQNAELRLALDRANTANRELSDVLQKSREDFESAADRVRYLAEQLRMRESQQKATERFNDNDRNY
jgi:ABC-type transporter Mla subunit MlaD